MAESRATGSYPAARESRGRVLANLRRRAAEWGWRRALYWQLMHALAGIGFRIHYVTIGADRPTLRLIYRRRLEVPEGYSVRWGTREDFLPLADDPSAGIDGEFLEQAFGRGDECCVVLFGEQIVNYSFWTRSWARVTDQLRVVVPRGFRYVYKDWTHPDHRRRRLSSLNAYYRNLNREAPFEERSISYVETHNYPSLLNTYRHPSERGIRCGLVGWITLFGRQIPFSSRHARWINFEFSRRPPRTSSADRPA